VRVRKVVQPVVILLLVLLAFWGCDQITNRETPIKRTGPETKGGFSDAPVSPNQTLMEDEMAEMTSPTKQPKAVIMPTSHSSWVKNGVYEVFGEAENVGKATGNRIRARVIVKSPGWRERLKTVETLIDRSTLAPGQKSSFRVRFDGVDPNDIGSYVLMMIVEPSETTFVVGPGQELQANAQGLRGETLSEKEARLRRDDSQSTGGSQDKEDAPDWIVLLLISTGALWSVFRYRQWQ